MDPFAALELPSGASPHEAAEAYRRLAKRWHPDRGGGAAAAARMAEINAAYDVLRAGAWQREPPPPQDAVSRVPMGPGRVAGAWLPEPLRRALGRELLVALEDSEDVALVTPAATWASPRTLLAVTDRRLLWLLDDVVMRRVDGLRFSRIASIDHHLRRPRRRVALLRVETDGRRLAFSELRPQTAEAIVRRVAEARAA